MPGYACRPRFVQKFCVSLSPADYKDRIWKSDTRAIYPDNYRGDEIRKELIQLTTDEVILILHRLYFRSTGYIFLWRLRSFFIRYN